MQIAKEAGTKKEIVSEILWTKLFWKLEIVSYVYANKLIYCPHTNQ